MLATNRMRNVQRSGRPSASTSAILIRTRPKASRRWRRACNQLNSSFSEPVVVSAAARVRDDSRSGRHHGQQEADRRLLPPRGAAADRAPAARGYRRRLALQRRREVPRRRPQTSRLPCATASPSCAARNGRCAARTGCAATARSTRDPREKESKKYGRKRARKRASSSRSAEQKRKPAESAGFFICKLSPRAKRRQARRRGVAIICAIAGGG